MRISKNLVALRSFSLFFWAHCCFNQIHSNCKISFFLQIWENKKRSDKAWIFSSKYQNITLSHDSKYFSSFPQNLSKKKSLRSTHFSTFFGDKISWTSSIKELWIIIVIKKCLLDHYYRKFFDSIHKKNYSIRDLLYFDSIPVISWDNTIFFSGFLSELLFGCDTS